jgi:hypothetical protein
MSLYVMHITDFYDVASKHKLIHHGQKKRHQEDVSCVGDTNICKSGCDFQNSLKVLFANILSI